MPAVAIQTVSAYFTISLPVSSILSLPAVYRPAHHGTGRLLVQLCSDPGGVGDIGQDGAAVLAPPRLGGLPAVLVQSRDGRLDIVDADADVGDRRFGVGGGRGYFDEGVAADLNERGARPAIRVGREPVGHTEAHDLLVMVHGLLEVGNRDAHVIQPHAPVEG